MPHVADTVAASLAAERRREARGNELRAVRGYSVTRDLLNLPFNHIIQILLASICFINRDTDRQNVTLRKNGLIDIGICFIEKVGRDRAVNGDRH